LAEKPSPLAKLLVGGAIIGSSALFIYNLFFRPKPTVQVALNSNPTRTIILVDGKIEVATPKTIALCPGKHRFTAMPKSPDLLVTYGFDKWTVNRQTVSYEPTVEINITRPLILTAQFIVVESGIYPIVPA